MKIVSVTNDCECILACVVHAGVEYNVYLQLPLTADCQHGFAPGSSGSDELLEEIAEFVDGAYTDLELNLLSLTGDPNHKYSEIKHNGIPLYVINGAIYEEAGCSSYYNRLVLEPVNMCEERFEYLVIPTLTDEVE